MNLNSIINSIEPIDKKHRAKAKAYLNSLAMPPWALGKLLDLAEDISTITGTLKPTVNRKINVVMAGDHGVTEEGVSQYPSEVTYAMVSTMLRRGAAINALCKSAGSEVYVVDMGVASDMEAFKDNPFFRSKTVSKGTKNMIKSSAMQRSEAIKSIELGFEVAEELNEKADIFGIGEMGIGNTTSATAIATVLTGLDVKTLTDRGTGIDDNKLKEKINTIEKAILFNQPDSNDGLDILSKVGGFEIGGMVGFILGCAHYKKPVIIDGFISTSAALIAHSLNKHSTDYMIFSHESVEKGHKAMLKKLNKKAYLDFDLRLGEGTGTALLMPLIDASVSILNSMFTLEEALAPLAE